MSSNNAERDTKNLFSGITLCVIGRSGTGKTALMAKLASVARAANDQRPVFIRFCGTSKGSVDGLTLVQSLCHQIQLVLQLPPQPVSNNYDEAVLMFHSLLNKHAMVLFIDRWATHPLSTHFNTLSIYLLDTPCQSNLATHLLHLLFNPALINFAMRIKLAVK